MRIPAALCGTVGLKTTVGRISRAGVYPLSWTLDSVGPLTRSVEDAALVHQALQGADPADDTTAGVIAQDVLGSLKLGVKGLRVAFGETVFFDDVAPEIAAAVREAGRVLQGLGAQVDSVATPEVAEAAGEQRRALMIAAEALAVNGRLMDEHFDALDPVVAHRMKGGRQLSATDYFAVLRQWAALRARIVRTLADVDVLLVPATQIPPRPHRGDRRQHRVLCGRQRPLPPQHRAGQYPQPVCGDPAVRLYPGRPAPRAHDLRQALRRSHRPARGLGLRAGHQLASAPPGPDLGPVTRRMPANPGNPSGEGALGSA